MTDDLRCSFCLKVAPEVAKLIAGPGAYICNECVDLCVSILASTPTPSDPSSGPDVPSWAAMTDDAILARLPLIAASGDQVEHALEAWVVEARRRGAAWARIGTALGISRQAAWERFVEAR